MTEGLASVFRMIFPTWYIALKSTGNTFPCCPLVGCADSLLITIDPFDQSLSLSLETPSKEAIHTEVSNSQFYVMHTTNKIPTIAQLQIGTIITTI